MVILLFLLIFCHMVMTFVLYYITRDINENLLDLEKSIKGLYRRKR